MNFREIYLKLFLLMGFSSQRPPCWSHAKSQDGDGSVSREEFQRALQSGLGPLRGACENLWKPYGKPMGNQRKPMENQWKSGFTRDLEKLEWNIKKICWTYLEIGFVCPQDHQAWWASMILPSRMWIWWQPHGIPPGIWDFSAPGIFGFIMIDQQVFVNTIHNWWLIRLSVSGWLTQGPTYKCGISRVFLHLLPSGYD